MATSGIVNTTAYDGRYIEFAWSRKSYDITTNKTTISWTLTARGTGKYSKYNAAPFQVKIDGAQIYYSATRVTTTNGLQIASGTHTFTHNTDGTKSFSVTVDAAIYYSAYNVSGSGTFTLDALPRAAKVTAINWANDEANPVISYNNAAGNNVTSLTLALLANDNTSICTRTLTKTATSYTLALTAAERDKVWAYYNKIKSTKATFIFKITTVIGGNTLTNQLSKIDLPMINSEPTITFNYAQTSQNAIDATGNANKFIKYVSDITYSLSAAGAKGATITTSGVSCGSYEAYDTLSGTITNVDSDTILVIIEDSRGGRQFEQITLDLINYIDLTTKLAASIEMEEETTAYITLNISGTFHNANFGAKANTLGIKYLVKINDDDSDSWLNISGVTVNVDSYGKFNFEYEIPFAMDYRNRYTVQVMVSDLFNTVYSNEVKLVALPVFDWSNADFNFNVPIKFNGVQMQDYIVEQGTKDNWYYRKWSSGAMECWRRLQITANVTNVWGSLYTSGALSATNLTYPYEFTETPILNVNLASFGSGGLIMSSGNNYGSETSTGALEIARGTQYSGGQYLLNYYAFGRYK